jgi:hypothetical protein
MSFDLHFLHEFALGAVGGALIIAGLYERARSIGLTLAGVSFLLTLL